jgi:pimeloyl-ACP methyl ester carboxylesterase
MTTTADVTGGSVRSADGTTIAFERSGAGPALILVDAAGGYRAFGPMRSLARLLAADFTVVTYDRRGRGDSGDTLAYAVEREVDDLAALIAEVGGSAYLYGFSSGALLALHAAAGGLAVPKAALLEPPIGSDDDRSADFDFTTELAGLVAAGRRRDAVEFFHRSIGVPPEVVARMEPAARRALEDIAHTLVYDCMVSQATSFDLVGSVTAPTLVIDSHASGDDLSGWAAAVAGALPNGTHRSLAGEWHGVADEVLAPVLTGFLRG